MQIDSRGSISQQYIEQKVAQIQTKLGITLPENTTNISSNYILYYLKNLASERISAIVKSLHHSLRLFINLYLVEKELTVDSEYVIIPSNNVV